MSVDKVIPYVKSGITKLPRSVRINCEALLVALLLVVIVFPDVIFHNASLRITDQVYGSKLVDVFELERTTGWWGGYSDNGGPSWQSEPMMEFMKNSVEKGELPYWNPYSAGGSMGPETLVDQKFSLLTIIYSMLGGGTENYNNVLLSLYFIGIFFVYKVARQLFATTMLASLFACVFYILNGFSIANVASNVTQAYLYIPFCLYAAISFINRPTTKGYILSVLAFSIFMTTTFLPTSVTFLVGIYIVITGCIFSKYHSNLITVKQSFGLFLLTVSSIVSSILLLAFLYFPVIESIISFGSLDDYSDRKYFPLFFPQAIISFFTSSHFYELYNSMESKAIIWSKEGLSFQGNTIYHLGTVSILIASAALNRTKDNILAIFCFIGLTIVFFRLFGLVGFSNVFSILPVLGNIGAQYWWGAVIVPTLILVILGADNLAEGRHSLIIPTTVLLVLAISVFYLFKFYGIGEPNIEFKKNSLDKLFFVFFVSFILVIVSRYSKIKIINGICLLVLATISFVDLFIDSKPLRLEKNDYFSNPHGEMAFLKDNIGLFRTMNIGHSGLRPELGSAFGIQEITSLNQSALPRYLDYFYSAFDMEPSQRFFYIGFPTLMMLKDEPSKTNFNFDKINLLGVKYIVIPAHYSKYKKFFTEKGLIPVYTSPTSSVLENLNVYPRAILLDESKVIESSSGIQLSHENGFFKRLNITEYKNTSVKIEGISTQRQLVVLTDNYHENWTAFVNGVRVPIHLVEGNFRGVWVDKGSFVVEMQYSPKSLPISIIVSLLMLVLLITLSLKPNLLDRVVFNRFRRSDI